MSDVWRIFGLELSPYSVKVRAYFRYKRIPHEWLVRHMGNMAEFQRHAKLPLIPLVLAPDGSALQDSTPIIEALEARFPEPSIHPPDPACAFLSALLEEYGDEWGNKWMFHYRWSYEPDQRSAARRIAQWTVSGREDGGPEDAVAKLAASLEQRMVPRLAFVGSNATTRPLIEASFERAMALVEAHLAARPFLFGARPAFADFGLWAQVYELSTDPTPGAWLRAHAPRTMAWAQRMLAPAAEGAFEPWSALAPTLEPLLREELAARFLPWSTANAIALKAGQPEFTVNMGERPFTQQPQKYHARSLGVLKERYRKVADRAVLDPVLERTGCLAWLRG